MFPNQGYSSTMMVPQNMGYSNGVQIPNMNPMNMNQGLSSSNAGFAVNPQMPMQMPMQMQVNPINRMNQINQMGVAAPSMSSQRGGNMSFMSFNENSLLNQNKQMGLVQPPQQAPPQPQNNNNEYQNIPASSDPVNDLMKAATVKIDQRSNFCKLLTCAFCGCENIYDVIIEDRSKCKKHLFELEEKNCCLYHCCIPGSCRGFNMDINAISDKDGKKMSSPLAVIERPCKLGCLCCCRPELYVKQGNGILGKVVMPCNLCGSEFEVYNEKVELKYIIKLDCCQCGFCIGPCCNIKGDIFEAKSKALVGVLTKDCSVLHCCTKADTYHLNFPNNATFNDRMNLIAAVMLIDYRLFE